ncbi:MAG: aspartyl protease family protein, partial [Planctomycetales bacterium]|nr:aspartyl protease family protein [Planctomycetales bacterium]
SILATDDSVAEMNSNGYRTEGTFYEQGVGGFTEFDVSAKYHVNFGGADGAVNTVENARILSSETESFCPLPGFCSFFGIAGMPLMDGRVTTFNISSLGGGAGGGFDLNDILSGGGLQFDFLETTFSDTMPDTNLRRYHVPLSPLHFPAEGDGPLPSWSDISSVHVITKDVKETSGNFIVDTGAQLSLISSAIAFDMGLDANGNGTLDDEAIAFQDIGGVGGTVRAPVVLFDELRVPTSEGVDLIYKNMQVAVIDIDPQIDGIFGMNMLSSGWSGSLFGDLSDLADLLGDAGMADLLELLGGFGAEGSASPYGFFEKAHMDLRNWSKGKGELVLDLTADVSGIMAGDGTHGDLDGDGDLDIDDRRSWVHDVKQTYFGDSNLDQVFDSRDLVAIFAAGEYEDGVAKNSTWATGDWNMDCEFDTKDLVLAFQDGGYTSGVGAAHSVPEPAGVTLLMLGLLCGVAIRRRRT